jgi:hypothetical protein
MSNDFFYLHVPIKNAVKTAFSQKSTGREYIVRSFCSG